MSQKRGFTLVEVLIVVTIAGILLGMMMNLWWDYVQLLQFQQDRESYINAINKTVIRWRTTNYYNNTKYRYLDITLNTGNVSIFYGTSDASTTPCSTWVAIENISLEKSVLSWMSMTLPYTVRIEPYKLWCKDYCSASGSVKTWTFASISNISDDETCFLFNGHLCKFTQTTCE